MLAAALLVGLVGFGLGRCGGAPASDHEHAATAAAAEIWTCPMHPSVRLPEFGLCPICSMDLVPATAGGPLERGVELSAVQVELAGVRTALVERRTVLRQVRLSGMVQLDETARQVISASVNGRLERLFADFVGMPVSRGDHLVEIFSPGLLSAQAELIGAAKRLDKARETSSFLAESDLRAYDSARTKLTLWGLSIAQVDEIVARGTAADRMVLESPVSGVILAKHKVEGEYVGPGAEIYELSDLSRLWIELEAFERDLAWLRYGQEVEIEVPAVPGERIAGRLTFIDPILDVHRRTARVRVAVQNPEGRLKPGMFAIGRVAVLLGANGPIVDEEIAGQWICPMHPEVVGVDGDDCRLCGMALVSAERLGLAGGADGEPALVVPDSALLGLGDRVVVYTAEEVEGGFVYTPREVLLGARAEGFALVKAGLEEGDRVVVDGAFRVDASAEITGAESWIEIAGEATEPAGEVDPRFGDSLVVFFEGYLSAQEALAGDDPARVAALAPLLDAGAQSIDWSAAPAGLGSGPAELKALVAEFNGAGVDVDAQRTAFEPLSMFVISALEAAGAPADLTLERVHCPMAFDFEGADWVQRPGAVNNPYFGAEMLTCGTATGIFGSR